MEINDFSMTIAEQNLLRLLLKKFKPLHIAEFGSGGSTCLLAEASDATIVSWENTPEWLELVKTRYCGCSWFARVAFCEYEVTPCGPRDVEKDCIEWHGEPFDFIFIDGPRAAHPTSFGRYGSFKFAIKYARQGACLVWHDNRNDHVMALVDRYFNKYYVHDRGTIGWCLKRETLWHHFNFMMRLFQRPGPLKRRIKTQL